MRINALVQNGARNENSAPREQNDFYATDPKAVELLLEQETFSNNIWECACGAGHLSEPLKEHGYSVLSTDIIDRGYGDGACDFLAVSEIWNGDIITNPPFSKALEFCKKALACVRDGHKVAMFLKIQFLESKARKEFLCNTLHVPYMYLVLVYLAQETVILMIIPVRLCVTVGLCGKKVSRETLH